MQMRFRAMVQCNEQQTLTKTAGGLLTFHLKAVYLNVFQEWKVVYLMACFEWKVVYLNDFPLLKQRGPKRGKRLSTRMHR